MVATARYGSDGDSGQLVVDEKGTRLQHWACAWRESAVVRSLAIYGARGSTQSAGTGMVNTRFAIISVIRGLSGT